MMKIVSVFQEVIRMGSTSEEKFVFGENANYRL
jgi:hypothetical protein